MLERFGRVDSKLNRRYEGVGLGLALTRELIALHGGTLEFDSAVGIGTTATILFPAGRIMERRAA
jgi:signal transduction histidine kinase